MIPGKGDLQDYWRGISNDGDFLGPPPSYTLNRDPVLRLCHRMMAHSIAGRSQTPEKVTVTDLFYLRGLDVRSFVARLAEHFGLLTADILRGLAVIAPKLLIIDMGELVRLKICMEVDDTWAWVVMRPEGQLDVTAGAPGQREVIDVKARDFSRFNTWAVTGLTWTIDRAGLPTCHILRPMYLIKDVESDRGLARPAPPQHSRTHSS
ncbi:hypothetical protein Tco_0365901 [Tanacetum coccineum]